MAESVYLELFQDLKVPFLAVWEVSKVGNFALITSYLKQLIATTLEVGFVLSFRSVFKGFQQSIHSAMVLPANSVQKVALRLIGTVHIGANDRGTVL